MKQLKRFAIITISILLVILCLIWYCNYKETKIEAIRQELLKTEKFNSSVLNHAKEYNNLKDFLLLNVDTIIKFCNLNNKTGNFQHDNCFSFPVYGSDTANDHYSNFPDFLKPKLLEIINAIESPVAVPFRLCKDKKNTTIEINIPYEKIEPQAFDIASMNIEKYHQLIYNQKQNPVDTCLDANCDLLKDTLLFPDLLYQIRISRYLGL